MLDTLRVAVMLTGATGTALAGAHAVLALCIAAFTVIIAIGMFELAHR